MKTSLPSSVERVRAALSQAGLDLPIREFPQSTGTAAEAALAVGTSVGQIVKSLVFTAAGRPVLALVSGSNRLDPERLAALVGQPVERADADTVRRATGFAIGGVPPVGFPAPISCYLDVDLLRYDRVWAAAGTPHHVFAIATRDLLRITGALPTDLKHRD